MRKVCFGLVLFSLAVTGWLGATDISYVGELSMHGVPANGWFDIRFQVFDHKGSEEANALGGEILVPGVQITDGLFRFEIEPGVDFGDRSEIWLEIGVRQANAFGNYTTLEPRQKVVVGAPNPIASKSAVSTGGVVFFDSTVCPNGWSEYLPARGRHVLGLPFAGTVGATFGTPLTNLEIRTHDHPLASSATTSTAGQHGHAWSRLFINGEGKTVWVSHNANGGEVFLTAWGNGMGGEGSGYYPLTAQPTQTFYTTHNGSHAHNVNVTGSTEVGASQLPYVQLLACRKD